MCCVTNHHRLSGSESSHVPLRLCRSDGQAVLWCEPRREGLLLPVRSTSVLTQVAGGTHGCGWGVGLLASCC